MGGLDQSHGHEKTFRAIEVNYLDCGRLQDVLGDYLAALY